VEDIYIYIYTDGDDKKTERDMYVVIQYFRGCYDHCGYEKKSS